MKIYISVVHIPQPDGQQTQHVNICASTNIDTCRERIEEYPKQDGPIFTLEVWENGFEVEEKIDF